MLWCLSHGARRHDWPSVLSASEWLHNTISWQVGSCMPWLSKHSVGCFSEKGHPRRTWLYKSNPEASKSPV